MSRILVETFVALSERVVVGGNRFITPTPRALGAGLKVPTLILGNAPMPAGVHGPDNGLTGYHGNGATSALSDEVASAKRSFARQQSSTHESLGGLQVLWATLEVEVGQVTPRQGQGSLGDSRVLNLVTCLKALRDEVAEKVLNYLARKGRYVQMRGNRLDPFGRLDALYEVLRADPRWKHLAAVICRVPDGTPRGRQVATVFTDVAECRLPVRGDTDLEILLP